MGALKYAADLIEKTESHENALRRADAQLEADIAAGGGGTSDHALLTNLTGVAGTWDHHPLLVNKHISGNLTVGHTTDIHAIGTVSSGTHTPDLTLERTKTMTVGGSFTLGKPTTTGLAAYFVTVSGSPPAGGWTITGATDVVMLNGVSKVESGKEYALYIDSWGSGIKCIAQLVEVKNT